MSTKRHTTKADAAASVIEALGEHATAHDVDAIVAEAFEYRVDRDEDGRELLDTAGYEQTADEGEFWEIVRKHQTTPDAPAPEPTLTEVQAHALNNLHTAFMTLVRAQRDVATDTNQIVQGYAKGFRGDANGNRWTTFLAAQVRLNTLLEMTGPWATDATAPLIFEALTDDDTLWFRATK